MQLHEDPLILEDLRFSADWLNWPPCLQIMTEAGGTYLEAPVGGSKQPAEQGNLVFLCGGDKALFDLSAPLLDVMGKAKFFLGEVRPWQYRSPLCLNAMLNALSAHLTWPQRTPSI